MDGTETKASLRGRDCNLGEKELVVKDDIHPIVCVEVY